MKNKILIYVYVPTLDETYEVYIPVNESIKVVSELIEKVIESFSDSAFIQSNEHCLFDPDTSNLYSDREIVRDTNIRNNKHIILI